MNSIHQLSAVELAESIRRRELSPLEAVSAYIERAERVNPALNAIIADRFEQAHDEAQQATEKLAHARPEELPPLFGVPCTMKEFYAVRGLPQTGGLLHRKDFISESDAEVVARVRRAGAIVLGVTNVPEGGLWLETDNRVYGRTNNPWDVRRTPGGSSGGEGAIVAAGGSAFGMGSDIGGSIRLPAFFCGIAGHKPSARLVPNEGHWPPLAGNLGGYLVCGPLARHVADLELLLEIVAKEPLPARDSALDFKELTVFPLEEGGAPLEPSMREAVRRAAKSLADRGARLVELPQKLLKDAFWIWAALMSEEQSASYAELVSGGDGVRLVRELFGLPFGRSRHTAPVLAVIAGERVMKFFPRRSNQKLLDVARQLKHELEQKLGDRGVLLHPPYTRPAPRHGVPLLRPFDGGYTAVFNVLELPATQVPTGLDPRGLPLGVQVVAARGRDRLSLAVARALEEDFGVLGPIDPRPKNRPRS